MTGSAAALTIFNMLWKERGTRHNFKRRVQLLIAPQRRVVAALHNVDLVRPQV